eukprot:jgi/Chrzof1/7209/Cz02g14260.t1
MLQPADERHMHDLIEKKLKQALGDLIRWDANVTEFAFSDPVTEKLAPDYFDVVSHPMDLTTMSKKLKNGSYKHVQEGRPSVYDHHSWDAFWSDVDLIVANCKAYNDKPNDEFFTFAEKLEGYAKQRRTVLWQQVVADMNTARSMQATPEVQTKQQQQQPPKASPASTSKAHIINPKSQPRSIKIHMAADVGGDTHSSPVATAPAQGQGLTHVATATQEHTGRGGASTLKAATPKGSTAVVKTVGVTKPAPVLVGPKLPPGGTLPSPAAAGAAGGSAGTPTSLPVASGTMAAVNNPAVVLGDDTTSAAASATPAAAHAMYHHAPGHQVPPGFAAAAQAWHQASPGAGVAPTAVEQAYAVDFMRQDYSAQPSLVAYTPLPPVSSLSPAQAEILQAGIEMGRLQAMQEQQQAAASMSAAYWAQAGYYGYDGGWPTAVGDVAGYSMQPAAGYATAAGDVGGYSMQSAAGHAAVAGQVGGGDVTAEQQPGSQEEPQPPGLDAG